MKLLMPSRNPTPSDAARWLAEQVGDDVPSPVCSSNDLFFTGTGWRISQISNWSDRERVYEIDDEQLALLFLLRWA